MAATFANLFPSNLNKSVPTTGNAWVITVGGNVVGAWKSKNEMLLVLHRALVAAGSENQSLLTGVLSIHYAKNGQLLLSPTATSTGGRFA